MELNSFKNVSTEQLRKCAKLLPGYIDSIQGRNRDNLLDFFIKLFREEEIPIPPNSITSEELRKYGSDYDKTSMMYLSHTTNMKNLQAILKTGYLQPAKQLDKNRVWINKKANPNVVYFSPVFNEIDYANIYSGFYGKKFDFEKFGVITERFEPDENKVVLLFSTDILKDFSNDYTINRSKHMGFQDWLIGTYTHKDISKFDENLTNGQVLIPKTINILPYLRFIIGWKNVKHPLYRKPWIPTYMELMMNTRVVNRLILLNNANAKNYCHGGLMENIL